MDYRIEVLNLAVADVDRALEFYTRLGFTLDVDYRPGGGFRVVQLTPPGSAASIQLTSAPSNYLVVGDIEAAHRELTERGVAVTALRHKAGVDWQGDFEPGVDPERRGYASFFDFADPDGNTWTVQEKGFTG